MEGADRRRSVRHSYDMVADEYLVRFANELEHKPLDRALLGALIEQTEPGFPVADIGCGPGHVAAWVAGRGHRAVGVDLSPKMSALGRREYPYIEFREGDFLSLPADASEFGSVIAFYSIIHLEAHELPFAFAEVNRVLRPSGLLLLSFHAGSEVRHLDDWWGHGVEIDFHFFETEEVVSLLENSGFVVQARMERKNYPEEVETRRAYILARRLDP